MRIWILLPEVLVVASALALLAVEGLPSRQRPWLPLALVAALAVALGLELWLGAEVGVLFGGGYVQDRFALLAKSALLLGMLVAVLAADWDLGTLGVGPAAMLLAGFGGMVAASSATLVGLWAGFELACVAVAVAATAWSPELALRMLVFTAVGATLLATSLAFLYAAGGTATLDGLHRAMALEGVALPLTLALLVGLAGLLVPLFLAPLPPAGAGVLVARAGPPEAELEPTSLITGGIAAPVSAAAAMGAGAAGVVAIKLLAALAGIDDAWAPYLAVSAGAAMVLGGIGSLASSSPRLVAGCLGVVQLGWLAAGISTHSRPGTAGALLLLVAFLVAAAGMAALLPAAVPGALGLLSARQPARGAALALCLLSVAGAPPLAGFFGEFAVAAALARAGLFWLLAVGLLSAGLALVGAAGVLRALYLEAPPEEVRRPARSAGGLASVGSGAALAIVVLVLVFGLLANPISSLAFQAAAALGLR